MRASLFALSILGALGSAACSSKDPFANTGSDGGGGGDGKLTDGGSSGGDAAPHHCAAAPSRIVVLGDSITACSVIGGPQNADCVSKKFSDYVIAHYGTSAAYENHAVGGAKLADIAGQLATIQPAAGPALVMIYIGGNDLSPYIFQSDQAATTGWQMIETQMVTVYDNVFSKLANTTTFPSGATLLMNTQYNPFDDCTASPYNLSATKIGILHMFNDKVKSIAAAHGDAAIVVDQHGPYLGHGHHYNVATCPFYQANAVPWMQDTIHANAAGNVDLANVMNGGADRLYRDCIP
jgi:lysophospholipase L1-like esterase